MSKKLNKIVSAAVLTTMVAGTGIVNPEIFGGKEVVAQAEDKTEPAKVQEGETDYTNTTNKLNYKVFEKDANNILTSSNKNGTVDVKDGSFTAPATPAVLEGKHEFSKLQFGEKNKIKSWFGKTKSDPVEIASKPETETEKKAVDVKFIGWGITFEGTEKPYVAVKPGEKVDIPNGTTKITIIPLYGEQKTITYTYDSIVDSKVVTFNDKNKYGMGDVVTLKTPENDKKLSNTDLESGKKLFIGWESNLKDPSAPSETPKYLTEYGDNDTIDISGDVTYTAKYAEPVTITFNDRVHPENNHNITVGEGRKVKMPTASDTDNLKFKGWREISEDKGAHAAGKYIDADTNKTYNAVYNDAVTVTFDDPVSGKTEFKQEKDTTLEDIEKYSEKAKNINTDLEIKGYIIDGGYKTKDEANNITISKATTIKPVYTVKVAFRYATDDSEITTASEGGKFTVYNSSKTESEKYDIEQQLPSGKECGIIDVEYGTDLLMTEAPTAPTLKNYIFVNDRDKVLEKTDDGYKLSKVTSNKTVILNYKETVNATVQGSGENYPAGIKLADDQELNDKISVSAVKGEKIVAPKLDEETLKKAGLELVGWEAVDPKDKEDKKEFTKDSNGDYVLDNVSKDVTITPVLQATVTLDGKDYKVRYNNVLIVDESVAYPSKDGYIFKGWYDSKEVATGKDPSIEFEKIKITDKEDPNYGKYESSKITESSTNYAYFRQGNKIDFVDSLTGKVIYSSQVAVGDKLGEVKDLSSVIHKNLYFIGWDNEKLNGTNFESSTKLELINKDYLPTKSETVTAKYGTEVVFKNGEAKVSVKATKDNPVYIRDDSNGKLKEITKGDIPSQIVEYGKNAIEPEVKEYAVNIDEKGEKAFKKWDKSFTNIKGGDGETATYTVKGVYDTKRTVHLFDEDGKTPYAYKGKDGEDISTTDPYANDIDGNIIEIKDGKANIIVGDGGSIVLPKGADVKGKTFKYWTDGEKTYEAGQKISVTADIDNLTAVYGETKKVTFNKLDGTVLGVKEVAEGTAAEAPEAPAIEGLTFKKWDKSFDNVTGDITVNPIYVAKVTVGDKETEVEYGKDINDAITPEEKDGLNFKEYRDADGHVVTKVTKDIKVTPVYTAAVVLEDANGNIVGTLSLEEGQTINPADIKYNVGKDEVVVGWANEDGSLYDLNTPVEKDMKLKVVTGYEVSFEGIDVVQKVAKGENAVKPEAKPSKEGLEFAGWDYDFDAPVNGKTTVKATYKARVTFVDTEGKEIKSDLVIPGTAAIAPEVQVPEGKVLSWDVAFDKVEKNTTVKEVLKDQMFKVTYKAGDKVVSESEVAYGTDAQAPKAPEAPIGYYFVGWDKEGKDIKADTVVNAKFEKLTNTVTFVDGTDIKKVEVKYGEDAVAPTPNTPEGKVFVGWVKVEDTQNVTEDRTVVAKYSDKILKVTVDVDGTTSVQDVVYGKDAHLETPTKEGYDFVGWDGQTTGIKADGTIKAIFKIKTFNVIVDGVSQTVEYGKDVKLPTPAEKEGYDFVGWDGQTTGIKADGTVNSKYEIKKFTVVVDGVAQTVEYGKDVKLPTPAEKEGYTFKGWEGQTTGIKADGEVHAIYEKNPDTPGTETPGTVTPAPTADAAQTGSLAAMILMAFASLTAFFKRGKKSRK